MDTLSKRRTLTALRTAISDNMPTINFGRVVRLLIAEDDEESLGLMQTALSDGIREIIIDVARDGEEALVKMKELEFYDLVILSMMLPRLSGVQVCHAMGQNKRLRGIPVLLISILPITSPTFTESLLRHDEFANVRGVLEIPFTKNALLLKVSETIRKKHTNHVA